MSATTPRITPSFTDAQDAPRLVPKGESGPVVSKTALFKWLVGASLLLGLGGAKVVQSNKKAQENAEHKAAVAQVYRDAQGGIESVSDSIEVPLHETEQQSKPSATVSSTQPVAARMNDRLMEMKDDVEVLGGCKVSNNGFHWCPIGNGPQSYTGSVWIDFGNGTKLECMAVALGSENALLRLGSTSPEVALPLLEELIQRSHDSDGGTSAAPPTSKEFETLILEWKKGNEEARNRALTMVMHPVFLKSLHGKIKVSQARNQPSGNQQVSARN